KVIFNQVELSPNSVEASGLDPELQKAHLQIPIPARSLAQPALLELQYRWSASSRSLFQRTLAVPSLGDGVALRAVRWRVEWRRGGVSLGGQGAQFGEQLWHFFAGIWPPGPAALAGEMDQWLTGQESRIGGRGPENGGLATADERPALSFMQLGSLQ